MTAHDRTLPNPATEPTVTVDRAAAILGISRAAAFKGAAAGELPCIRVGRRLVVPTAALLAMLEVPAA